MKKTRAEAASELKERVLRGPVFSDFAGIAFTKDRATEEYQRWAESWVLPLIERLVPELKQEVA
jgi:hypothetical protein